MDPSKTVRVSSTTVGDFRLVRRLGGGSFGDVYEAVHVTTGLSYALKKLRPSDEPERFEKEALYPAKAARQSLHVLSIHSFFPGPDGEFYLATELIPHGDLASFLKTNAPLSVQSALELSVGIAKGLAAIHKDGIVHLDLKPANILMDQKDDRWIPKLADFGLARASGSVHLNRHGTVPYASPEHFDERLSTGPASDMFSFGMMVYELVTGTKASESSTVTEYASYLIRAVPPPPPSTRRAELAGRTDLDDVLAELLQFDVSKRTMSAAAAVDRLTACLNATASAAPASRPASDPRDVSKAAASRATPAVPPVPAHTTPGNTTPGNTVPQIPAARTSKPLPIVPIAAGVALVAVLGAGGWFFTQKPGGGPTKGMSQFRAKDYAAAFPLLLDEAKDGKADAQSALGTMYARGLSVPRNVPEARSWLDKAVEQDNDEARCMLGDLWREGAFGSADPGRARDLYTDASGKPCGSMGLGEMLLKGEGGGKASFDEALRHFETAAENGDAAAVARVRDLHAGWTFGPLLQGPWQAVVGDDRRNELGRLSATKTLPDAVAGDPRRLRRLAVDFYADAALYELEVGLPGGGVGAFEYIRRGDVITALDGTADRVYGLNASAPIRVDTMQRAALYLRFFMAAVQDEKGGTFRIVDGPSDLPWAASATSQQQGAVASIIRNWEMSPSGSGGWQAKGTVAFNRGLLNASFELRTSGVVELEGREQIAQALPVLKERFVAPGVRVVEGEAAAPFKAAS